MRASSIVLAAAAAATLAGCASYRPAWSEVVGYVYHPAIADRRPVHIFSVGEQGGWANDRPLYVDPGLQRIVVEAYPHAGFRGGRTEVITVDLKPCMRYYIAAQFEGPISPQFTPVVDEVIPVPGCKASAAVS